MYTHVYIRGREQKINREGLFVTGRKCAKYLHSKLPLQRTGITRMQFLIGFDRLLRTGRSAQGLSPCSGTVARKHSL